MENSELGPLLLKYLVCRHIDGSWGDGDEHLENLKLLYSLLPDSTLKTLIARIEKSKSWIEKNKDPELYEEYGELYITDTIYRDEGKVEAEYYKDQIISLFGQETFNLIEKLYL
jgi:hypothetical protein